MNLNINLFKIETNHVAPSKGRILIAEPFLPGSYFNRAIILLVAHSDKGAIGFILNKKIDYPVNEILGDFPEFEAEVYIGGPVSTDTIYFIHSLGKLIPGSIHVKDNIYWGGDFEEVKRLIREGLILPGQIRFFLGYSGWDNGQLEEEIGENSWLVSEIEEELVMVDRKTTTMWVEAVREIGGKYSLWEHFPENPSLN
ncbi:YqgE/AlgH family protein [Sunxiuqinia elliptica]|uniref:Putative transcriptional regulator n=1 Tax=Sunxiuqinia elliptica TaxID=655355 RepID=A0A1I2JSG5_9BACT|nr:YqgE/AlgH family protein [Sunxiuqinia elliptica]TDO03296.1 putative transcriptional regulator [Sunxiuqinia elliptica]TDO59493.1 putative transcriptional regulator [Sunxiuqinia elliptica]SFF56923.1 putative transcriptional regulator [Sunxiuqinia elliptica]